MNSPALNSFSYPLAGRVLTDGGLCAIAHRADRRSDSPRRHGPDVEDDLRRARSGRPVVLSPSARRHPSPHLSEPSRELESAARFGVLRPTGRPIPKTEPMGASSSIGRPAATFRGIEVRTEPRRRVIP